MILKNHIKVSLPEGGLFLVQWGRGEAAETYALNKPCSDMVVHVPLLVFRQFAKHAVMQSLSSYSRNSNASYIKPATQ